MNNFFEIFNTVPYIKIYSKDIFLAFLIIFIYFAFQLKGSTLPFYWPISILRNLAMFLNSILLLPFCEIFLSFFNCKALLTNYNMTCFQGEHIAHTFFAIIGIIILLIFSIILAIFYFDIKTITNNTRNRENTSYDINDVLFKIIIVFVFEFLPDIVDKDNLFISFLLLIGSWVLFVRLSLAYQYFFKMVHKVI